MITQEHLKSILDYDLDTGLFKWKVAKQGIKIGDIAGTIKDGYIRIRIEGHQIYAHRLAWFYIHGNYPEKYIDHINGVKTDNRLCNLREANASQNALNKKLSILNSSGVKNVTFCKSSNKWRVRFKLNNKDISLGMFEDLELAELVASEARNKYHGEFARDK